MCMFFATTVRVSPTKASQWLGCQPTTMPHDSIARVELISYASYLIGIHIDLTGWSLMVSVWSIARGLTPQKPDADNSLAPMRQPTLPKNANEAQEPEKVPFLVAKRIREGILDEVFKPGPLLRTRDRGSRHW
jgi:hypothetical protein